MTLRPSPTRDLSLDAFRGLTVLLMILVNVQGSGANAYAMLRHAEWNGVTLADLVFPWFLLIVGVSVQLAIDGRDAAWGRIVRRGVLLFAIGVALALMIRPTEPVRWMGVLQRIGIVYIACAAVAKTTRGWRAPATLAAVALAIHTALLLTPAPSETAASLAPGGGMAGWLDRLLPGRLYRTTWDPEGVLSTLSAAANAVIGLAAMRWLRDGPAARWTVRAMLLAVVLLAGAAVASLVVPLNKALWTAGFTLLTAGLGIALWTALRVVWPRIGSGVIGGWAVLAGQTALTLYVVHSLLIVLLVRRLPDGTRIWDAAFRALATTGLPPPAVSLLFAFLATLLSLAAIPPLKRRGWILKV